MSGLYLHFPFCNSKCIYCSFYSVASLKNQKEFINALLHEIKLRKNDLQKDPIQTLYFGGGTPSLFSIHDLSKILVQLKQSFPFSSQLEFTFESNPDQCTIEYLTSLQKLGINRLSIGIQSFNDEVLHFIGRKHDANQAILAVENAKKAGFSNISIDLIYGILNRKVGEWQQDLDIALSLPIKHLSAYALTVEENTKLFKQLSKNLSEPPHVGKDQDEELAILDMKILLESIKKSPFYRYEVSNFAIPGFESKHNSNYWNGTRYLGLGPSAHSYDGDIRSWNVASLTKYVDGMVHGKPISECEMLTISDKYNEAIMLGIRTSKGVAISEISKKYGEEFVQHLLHQLVTLDSDLYKLSDGILTVTEKGFPVIDHITEILFISED